MHTLWIGCTALLLAADMAAGPLTHPRQGTPGSGRTAVPGRGPARPGTQAGLSKGGGLAHAAGPVPLSWVRYHDEAASEDFAWDLAVDASGDVYVTGSATSALGIVEILLVKYAPSGVEEWSVTYPAPGAGPDFGSQVVIAPSGDVVVGGDAVNAAGDADLVALKFDPQGKLLWSRTFSGSGNDYDGMGGGRSLAVDGSGNVFIGGFTYDAVTGTDSVILKYDPSGDLLWTALYDGNAHGTDDNYDLALDAAGDVYAAAETTVLGQGRNLLALKYDGATGSLLWEVPYDGPASGTEVVNALAMDANANVYLVGISEGLGTGDDFVTMKVDTNGVLQWVRRYDGAYSRDDGPWDVAVSSAGLVVVTGFSGNRYLDSTAATVAYDTSGALQWIQRYDLSNDYFGDDDAFEVKCDAAGNAWVCGFGWDGGEHGSNSFLVRYSPSGALTFEAVHDGPVHADETAFGIALHGGNVYAGGFSQRGESHLDTLLLRYAPQSQGQTALDEPPFAGTPPAELENRAAASGLAPFSPLPSTPGRPERPGPSRRLGR